MLLNDAAAALKALRPDEALASLQHYQDLYRGDEEVARKCKIAAFLKEGLSTAPRPGGDLPPYLFQLWRSFEAFCLSLGSDSLLVRELRCPFFHKIVAASQESRLAESSFLAEGIPLGYAHLQTGEYDLAIQSLQASLIATPDNARTYGYLADAYLLRGDREVARQVYFEACLIDPIALDWGHLQDTQLRELRQQLPDEYDNDPTLAWAWLPAYAYVAGLFQPKQIRLLDEFKVFTQGYFELKKTLARTPSPSLAAKLFLKGVVLCDNEPFLRMVKGLDFVEVRREMKAAQPVLFAAYLKQLDRRKRKGA